MTSINPYIASTPAHFSTELAKPVITTIDNLCCYEVAGEDATDFLQSQFTNDVKAVDNSHAQLTAYCTPKGRMLATFFLCKRGENYLLITSSDLASDVMKRLQMYVMRSKVTITELSDIVLIGVSSQNAPVLIEIDTLLPENDYEMSEKDENIYIKIPGIIPRYLVVGTDKSLEQIYQSNEDKFNFYNHEYWQWLDILAGIPMVSASTQESFVPQMANMELIDGVSFTKGCYPGQEIVARLHYLGNANRRMFRVQLQSSRALQAGDDIYSSESDQSIGKFLSVVKVDKDKFDCLAVLRTEASKHQALTTSPKNGDVVKLQNLPYEIPLEAKEKKD